MAYSGKVTLNNMYEVWSYIIRFITSDSLVGGKDWNIIQTKVITPLNNLHKREFAGTLTSVTLDTWIDLPTISISDYSFGTKITGEIVGAGDGATTSFNYTVVNTPIGNYSIVINYTIAGSNYTAFDDGSGNITGTSVSGTINYSTGALSLTFTTAPDAGTNITIDYIHNSLVEGIDYQLNMQLGKVMFLSTGSVLAGSNVDYFYNFRQEEFYLSNTGLAGQDDVHFILKPLIPTNEFQMYIIGNLYDILDSSGNAFDRVGITGLCFWNNVVDLWIFSNKQRIIVVIKSGNYYSVIYAGFLHNVYLPNEFNNPIVISASHYSTDDFASKVDYFDETDNTHWFIGEKYLTYYDPENGYTTLTYYSAGHHQPQLKSYGVSLSIFNYPSYANKYYFPIYVTPNDNKLIGIYDNVFYYVDSSITAESILTDTTTNSTFICFPDVFRQSIKGFYIIKEE